VFREEGLDFSDYFFHERLKTKKERGKKALVTHRVIS